MSSEGSSLTVRQPALSKASLRVNRWLPKSTSYRPSVLTHNPDWRVAWAILLIPPKVGEVSQALWVDQPAQVGIDSRGEARALDGDLPVAFDEDDDDILAPQSGEQV